MPCSCRFLRSEEEIEDEQVRTLLGTPKARKHKHFMGISLIGLLYKGVCMGYPYPSFTYVLFWGLILNFHDHDPEHDQSRGHEYVFVCCR